jgi:hypothetical protein
LYAGLGDHRFAVIDVEMQMLGVLVLAEVCQDAGGTVLQRDMLGDPPYDREELMEGRFVRVAEVDQGRDVLFGDDHDVDGPVWAGVVKCQHISGFQHDVDRCPAAERLIAVEVLGHDLRRLASLRG